MEKKPASLLVVSLGKALNRIPPALSGSQLAIARIKQLKNTYVVVPSALDYALKSYHNELPVDLQCGTVCKQTKK